MSGNVRDELQELVEWADKYPHAVEYGRIGVHVEKLRRAVAEMDRLTTAVGDVRDGGQS